MLDTRIKICGITSPEDAELSQSLGADYIGMIFANGSRRVSQETAKAIREAVPHAMLTGVFADTPIGEVVGIGRACGLNLIQLHGRETPEYCDALQSCLSLPIIKAFSVNQLPDPRRLRDYTRTSYFMFDLDKNHNLREASQIVNGQRERLWSTAAAIRSKGYRVFLAGGLSPANVREAVRRVGPYAIDVASGVESSPGIKDSEVLGRFITEVRR
jgi:phosphoribosylanthranilate isomerase